MNSVQNNKRKRRLPRDTFSNIHFVIFLLHVRNPR